jgi:multidrug efflux pump subunit AcrA (membrane-fusion protein)
VIPNVIRVPVRAVTTNNGVSTVVVATKGKVDGPTKTVTVRTGATANGMVQITSGLKEGEQILVPVLQFTTPTTAGSNPATNGTTNGTFGGFGNRTGNGGLRAGG